jgi:hypothetical protein
MSMRHRRKFVSARRPFGFAQGRFHQHSGRVRSPESSCRAFRRGYTLGRAALHGEARWRRINLIIEPNRPILVEIPEAAGMDLTPVNSTLTERPKIVFTCAGKAKWSLPDRLWESADSSLIFRAADLRLSSGGHGGAAREGLQSKIVAVRRGQSCLIVLNRA